MQVRAIFGFGEFGSVKESPKTARIVKRIDFQAQRRAAVKLDVGYSQTADQAQLGTPDQSQFCNGTVSFDRR